MPPYQGLEHHQRGMGATIVLFMIALIALVGAALAYANRGNPARISSESARVFSAVLLKQSADFRDAYSRFVFDGGDVATMTFNAAGVPAGDLFNPATQYGVYQAPPAQALAPGAVVARRYNRSIAVTGIGSTAPESIAWLADVAQPVCAQVNNQMYGTPAIPLAALTQAEVGAPGSTISLAPAGRATGCFATADNRFVFYSTLGES